MSTTHTNDIKSKDLDKMIENEIKADPTLSDVNYDPMSYQTKTAFSRIANKFGLTSGMYSIKYVQNINNF